MAGTRKPSFFWQGMLILLPMFGLTLAGLFSLWRDQVNSHREADERAEREASLVVSNIAAQFQPFPAFTVTPGSSSNLIKIDLFGETCRFSTDQGQAQSLFGVDSPDLEQTHRFSQVESWVSTPLDKPLEDPVYRLGAGSRNVRFCLLDERGNLNYPPPLEQAPQPPTDQGSLAAQDRYRRGLAQAQNADRLPACQTFDSVATNFPQALSESGLPLQVLARYQLASLRLADTNFPARGRTLIALAATAVLRPSALSGSVLDQARAWAVQAGVSESERQAIDGWLKVWKAHQASRQMWVSLRNAGRTNWLNSEDGNWVVCETSNSPAGCQLLLARPAEPVSDELLQVLAKNSVADYLALHATLARTRSLPDRSDKSDKVLLASADVPFPGDSQASLLRVSCMLERPDLLYAAQTRRLIIFALFLGVATISAAAGFITARRAFHRQLLVNEMKSNFVSAVSHELRAPIASVRLMAEGLDRGKVSEPARQKEYFRFIVQECRRLSSLIENVLDFSRIEQGRKKYEFEPTDLVALTQQTTQLMLPNATERQVALDLRLPCEPFPHPACDGLAIQQALINLIDNAIKHSPPGSTIIVGLNVAPATSPGPPIHLWVEDSGPGIPPEEHEKIFERFYRRGSELRRETQGVGIGLTIVKHIMEAHGGSVRVRSAVGQGSRFTLELPSAEAPSSR